MRNPKIWLSVFGIILVLGLGIFSLFAFDIIPQSSVGFSTLSLQSADLESSSNYFSGKTWILTVRLGGLGQTAYGKFSPSQIQSATDDETTTKKDFVLNVNQQDQQCVYPIQNAGQFVPIRKWAVKTWVEIPFVDPCTEQEANSKGISSSNLRYVFRPSGSLSCHAVYWTEQAPVGIYGKTDIRAKMNINIQAGDKSGSKIIDTEGSTQGAISDFAYVIWQGNLDTGKSCSYSTDMPYRPVYKNGVWQNADKQKYDLYVAKYNEGASVNFLGGSSEVTNYVNALNSRADESLVSKSFGAFDNPTSLNSAILRADLSSPIQNPVLTFYIKAETLGIYTPAPEIELSQATSQCFKTGESGTVTIKAKNIGNEQGVFNFYGNCQNAEFNIAESREYSFSAGQERTITLPISASASSKVQGTCIIYAENPSGTKQINVGVCVDPQQTCTPNELFCSSSGGSEVVKQCSSDGATSSIKQTCSSAETCQVKDGTSKCVEDGGNGGTGFWQSIKDFFSGIKNKISAFFIEFKLTVTLIVAFLSFVLITLTSEKLMTNFEVNLKTKYKWLISLGIGILLSVGIGFLAFTYFWWAIASVIAFFVIRIFI